MPTCALLNYLIIFIEFGTLLHDSRNSLIDQIPCLEIFYRCKYSALEKLETLE